jgi:hypothetical protein
MGSIVIGVERITQVLVLWNLKYFPLSGNAMRLSDPEYHFSTFDARIVARFCTSDWM